jgi:hypothetical protein
MNNQAITNHAGPTTFRRFVEGEATPGETKRIVRHLLAGCETCGERAAAARQPKKSPASWNYDAVFARLAQPVGAEMEHEEPVGAGSASSAGSWSAHP